MELEPLKNVHSTSNVTHSAYDPETRKLRVKFGGSGKTAEYDDVPPEVHDGLRDASSHGTYFAHRIKPHFKSWRYV